MESKDKINNENEHNNLKLSDFQDLTPIDDVDLTGYKEALDHAFDIKNNKIKNIAITGSYGSGKSSILSTYKKNSKLKFIHISFLHFKECGKDSTNTCENKEKSNDDKEKNKISDEKIREEILERKIINHIINQIPFEYIPYTNFNVRGKKGFKNSIVQVSFMASIFYIILFFTQYKLKEIFIFKFWKESKIQIFLLIVCIVIMLCNLIFSNNFSRGILSKIKFKNIELDTSVLGKYDSFFDKYLNEILYIFENCKANVIVFEDIDRIEMRVIFERLREINVLLNEKLKNKQEELEDEQKELKNKQKKLENKKVKLKSKIIKFCYLMREDIFNSEDRVKFFDFIIPIASIMNGFNSYDKILEYFNNQEITDKIDKNFLKEISHYITDVRLLKNISNEFLIYRKTLNIDEINLDHTKLLAIIVYKNLFPKDFNNLNHNEGFLFSIFGYSDVKREILDKYLNELNMKLEKYDDEIKNIKQNLKDTYNLNLYESDIKTYVFDLLLEKKPPGFLNWRLRKYIGFCHFRERDYKEYEVVYKNKKVLEELVNMKEMIKFKDEIIKDKYFIDCIKHSIYKDWEFGHLEQFNDAFKMIFNKSLVKLGHDGIKYRHFLWNLIKYGTIDKMWEIYTTNTPVNLINDKNFLLNIFLKDKIFNFDYKLSNVSYVVFSSSYIEYMDNKYIFNFDLLDYLLDKNDFYIFQPSELRNKLICFLLQLGEASNFNFVVEYFNNNIKKNRLKYNDNLIEKLTIIQIKFENINNDFLCEDLLKQIDQRNLYEINEENLRIILKRYGYESNNHLCSKIYSLICEEAESLNYYIHNRYNKNIYVFLIFYFKNCNNCIKDDSKHVVNLIKFLFNKNFENDENINIEKIFKNYLDLLDVKIILLYNFDVNEFKDKIRIVMYKYIFEKNVAKYCIENIYDYYLRIGQLDNFIIKFINESNENLKFSNMHDEDYFEFSLKILNNKENIEKFLSELKNDERIKENKSIEIQSCIDELDKF